jgi:hypothetical protein
VTKKFDNTSRKKKKQQQLKKKTMEPPLGWDIWQLFVKIFPTPQLFLCRRLSHRHYELATLELSKRADIDISNGVEATAFIDLFFRTILVDHVEYQGQLWYPRPNHWFGCQDGRGEHDPALYCEGTLSCWDEDEEHAQSVLSDAEFQGYRSQHLWDGRWQALGKLKKNPPAAFQPLVPRNDDAIIYHCDFVCMEVDVVCEMLNDDDHPAIVEELVRKFGTIYNDVDEAERKNLLIHVAKELRITNPHGINDDHRGSDHMNIALPFNDSVFVKPGVYTLHALTQQLITLRSHKFENWYELYGGLRCTSSDKTHLALELSFDHGS